MRPALLANDNSDLKVLGPFSARVSDEARLSGRQCGISKVFNG